VAADSDSDEEAKAIFRRAVTPMYLLADSLQYISAGDRDWAQVDLALDRLDAAALPIRSQLIRAASECLRHDGILTGNEYGLIRVLSGVLGCPIPQAPPR